MSLWSCPLRFHLVTQEHLLSSTKRKIEIGHPAHSLLHLLTKCLCFQTDQVQPVHQPALCCMLSGFVITWDAHRRCSILDACMREIVVTAYPYRYKAPEVGSTTRESPMQQAFILLSFCRVQGCYALRLSYDSINVAVRACKAYFSMLSHQRPHMSSTTPLIS